jgi:hypothetical protein
MQPVHANSRLCLHGAGEGREGGEGRVGVRPRGRIFTGVDGKNPSAGKSASVG